MRIALIGLGMVADTYRRAIAASDALVLHGVHARGASSRADFAARVVAGGGTRPREYATLAEIASDADVDAVVLATPPDARLEAVETLARAGKPLLLEKPLERDAAAARRIVGICERAAVPLGVMFQHRARESSRALKARLDAGELGTPSLVRIDVPWWREQGYYDEPGRGTYARDGGGVLISQAIHTMDLALWLVGDVAEVQGGLGTSALHRMEAEDVATAALAFENGALGSLSATTAARPGAPEVIEVHGTKGSARLASGTLELHWRDGREERHGETAATGAGADPMAFPHDWHQSVLEDFAAAVRDGRRPAIDGHGALPVQRLIDAIALSSREGRRVRVAEIETSG